MRATASLSLVGALIVAIALVSVSGAATAKTQKATKINVSTRAAVIHYLQSIHVKAKGAVIQRGALNYAGAHCPGTQWTCASTKHTVVQIAKRGGANRFVCKRSRCSVVQISGASHGVYISGRHLFSTAATVGNQTATCIKTTGLNQSCSINQTSSTKNNIAIVYENEPKGSGLTQTAAATASITQQATGAANGNTACVTQNITVDGSTVAKNGTPITVTLQAHQSVAIRQDSMHGSNSAAQSATSSGGCTGSSVSQQQTLSSTANGSGPITQNEDATYGPCGDGVTGDYANLCLDIEQNQSTGFKCTSSTSCPSSGTNTATFTQNSTQTAVANTPAGLVRQTQSTPPCSDSGAPAGCVAASGLVGTINQDSSGVSTASPTQNEVQCEDAAISGLSSCSHTADTSSIPSSRLTQKQYGPVGVGNFPQHRRGGRVLFSHLKGLGQAFQHGNSADQYTINQYSTQYADVGAFQQNFGNADCTTAGFCTAAQTTTINGASTSDGYTAPSISGTSPLTITCNGNSACVPTPPPNPTLTDNPTDGTTSTSATFKFTDPAKDANFICILDGHVNPTGQCGSPTHQSQAAGSETYNNLSYGTHHFQVKAVDQSGNESQPTADFSWTIHPPTPLLGPKPAATNSSSSAVFTWTDDDLNATFLCNVDNGGFSATNCASGNSFTSSFGPHTFQVEASDPAGNLSVPTTSYSWTNVPPDPKITATSEPTDPDFFGTSDTFTFTDTDPVTVDFQCTLDGTTTECDSGSINYTSTDLAPGPHTFSVRAFDTTNTYGSVHSDTYSWTILPLSVDALGTDGSSAGWACQPGGPIGLKLGTDSANTFGAITLTDVGNHLVSDLQEPTFTTDNYAAGSPRYYLTLSDDHTLWGYPPNSGNNGGLDFSWAIDNGNTYDSWADIQSGAEGGATVTGAYVIADGDQDPGTTDKVGELQFNGTTYNSGTCS